MEKVIDFAFSAQGYNHIKEQKVCQDASLCYSNDVMDIIAVADGHGSDDYPRTDRGSKFAVEAAVASTRRFVEVLLADGIDISADSNQRLEQLAKSILAEWHSSVESDLQGSPFSETELAKVSEKYKERYLSGRMPEKAYGTTLIMACLTRQFWFGIQIGDGKCVALNANCESSEPIPWDDSCQANITTSICDSDAISEFRYYYSRELPLAVFMGSDGIDDSYPSPEDYHSLYRSMVLLFDENCEAKGKEELQDYLPSLSRKGSGDDVSVAGILSPDVFHEKTVKLLKAINIHSKAVGEHGRKANEAKIASERLDYVLSAIKRAKMAYDSALEKEKGVREEIERSQIALEEAEQRLKESEEALAEAKTAFSAKTEPSEVSMPSLEFSDNDTSSCGDLSGIPQPSLTFDSDSIV